MPEPRPRPTQQPRAAPPGGHRDSHLGKQPAKRRAGLVVGESLVTAGEQEGRDRRTRTELIAQGGVVGESGGRALMHWDAAAAPVLAVADQQQPADKVDVVAVQAQRFAGAKASGCEQPDQRRERRGAQL
jgi:hypothetical protein